MIALVVTPSTRQVNVSGASTPSPSSTATDSLQRQQQQQQHEQLPTPTTPSFGSFGISAFGTKAASSSSGRAKKSKRPQTSSAITTTLNSGSRSLSLVQALKTTGAFGQSSFPTVWSPSGVVDAAPTFSLDLRFIPSDRMVSTSLMLALRSRAEATDESTISLTRLLSALPILLFSQLEFQLLPSIPP
jgi:hypothetical protein